MFEKIFKAYDIRGIYPEEINEKTVSDIARAYAEVLTPKTVVVGRDVRLSSESLMKAAVEALLAAGVDVLDIGVVSTDMLYFTVAESGLDGGFDVTASHNPGEYNGVKLVKEGAKPISLADGLDKIRDLAMGGEFGKSDKEGKYEKKDVTGEYLAKIFSFVDKEKIKPLKVVANPNFGASGKIVEEIAQEFKLELIKLNFEEDGNFPKGKPDPLQPENQKEISALVKQSGANFGVAWDADADRCFFFDEKGNFISAYYMTAILVKLILKGNRNTVVVQDPRLVWATRDAVIDAGGATVRSKAGRSFIGDAMREEGAIFAGEISGHYFFQDFYNCDNGMIPFLLILQYLSETDLSLSEVVEPFLENYPISGELNFTVRDADAILSEFQSKYKDGELDEIDGVSITYPDWRFNVRSSNTEPLLRLNIEAKNKELLNDKIAELTSLIEK